MTTMKKKESKPHTRLLNQTYEFEQDFVFFGFHKFNLMLLLLLVEVVVIGMSVRRKFNFILKKYFNVKRKPKQNSKRNWKKKSSAKK